MTWKFTDVSPTMNANNSPSPYVTSASSELVSDTVRQAWHAFDKNYTTEGTKEWLSTTGGIPGWWKVDLGAVNACIIRKYIVYPVPLACSRTMGTWTFDGSNDNSNWTTIHTKTFTDWVTAIPVTFLCTNNSTSYRYYRFNISAASGPPFNYIGIGELYLYTGKFYGGFSGFSPWIFLKDMWEKHDKLWKPKILIPKENYC